MGVASKHQIRYHAAFRGWWGTALPPANPVPGKRPVFGFLDDPDTAPGGRAVAKPKTNRPRKWAQGRDEEREDGSGLRCPGLTAVDDFTISTQVARLSIG